MAKTDFEVMEDARIRRQAEALVEKMRKGEMDLVPSVEEVFKKLKEIYEARKLDFT